MPRSCAPLFIPRILCDRGIYSLQLLLVLAQFGRGHVSPMVRGRAHTPQFVRRQTED